MDRDKVIETFRILSRGGHVVDPKRVEVWAVAHGWGARHAEELGKFADEIGRGGRKRTRMKSGSIFVGNIVDIWREYGAEENWEPY